MVACKKQNSGRDRNSSDYQGFREKEGGSRSERLHVLGGADSILYDAVMVDG